MLIPALDILQSVPVLAFLSITVTGFIALFPGSYLGLECASIFAIFTSQAWNLTFSFYHSLITQPRDLDEAVRLLGLSRWRRFWKLDVPNGAIGLVWNGMMSMGGGWFFLVASEAISVLNETYTLPGIGSYAGAAIDAGDLGKVVLAMLTMAILVIGVNVLFWRPLVAWSERFKNEQSEAEEVPRSMVLNLLRRSHWPRAVGRLRRRLAEPVNRLGDRVFGTDTSLPGAPARRRWGDVAFTVIVLGAIGYGTWQLLAYVTEDERLGHLRHPPVAGPRHLHPGHRPQQYGTVQEDEEVQAQQFTPQPAGHQGFAGWSTRLKLGGVDTRIPEHHGVLSIVLTDSWHPAPDHQETNARY